MFFSNNRKSSISTIEVEEAVGYEGVMGAQIAMYESVQNDYKLFEGALMGDFQEACMIHEGQSEEAVTAFQEGVISDMWDKLKELFKKLWAKIKSIFHAFIAKFNSVFMKSSKEFINKYKKEIAQKDLSKMEAKWSAKTSQFDTLVSANSKSVSVVVDPANAEKQLEDFETEDETLAAINALLDQTNKFSDLKTFAKDFHEECFEDEVEKEGFDDIKYEVFALLETADKTEKSLKKAQTGLEKAISAILKEIDKESKANIKDFPTTAAGASASTNATTNYANTSTDKSVTATKGGSTERKKVQTVLNLAQKRAQCVQTAVNKVSAAIIAEHKFNVAQARRIAAKMVAYNPKSKNESVMMGAIEEVAFYEAMEELK